MSSELGRRVKQLFEQAVELEAERRESFIREACGANTELEAELRSLLTAYEKSEGFLEGGELAGALEALGTEPGGDPLVGVTIGHYRLLSLLGRGGMGAVYRAEQDNPRREVALKLVDRMIVLPTLLRRFEVEAQVLARLQHPGIAQIYEAGTHETELGERPFFAMELVNGVPITTFADDRGLDRRERIETLVQVCEAVQHAHRVGVIHRDLKPANILVTSDGQPKILDFGIARSADSDLQVTTAAGSPGDLIGTLPYMSPEQVRGDPHELDTRADVYALGVLCFRLLTGDHPKELDGKTLTDAIRTITEEEPKSLRAATGIRQPADLETIVATALASDKERRYGSASDFAADLERFLDGQPITARPQGALYQLRMLVLRNRVPAALVASLILLSVGSAVVMSVQAQRTARERDRANLEASTAKEVSAFLESLFDSANPETALGETLTAEEILDRGAERIDSELMGQPLVKARLLVLIARVYERLGNAESAEPLVVEAVELGRRARASALDDAERASLHEGLLLLARLRAAQGSNDEAIGLCRESLALAEAIDGRESITYAYSLNSLAYQLALIGKFEESRTLIEQGLSLRKRLLGTEHGDVGWSLYQYAWLLHSMGDDPSAVRHFDKACTIWKRTLPEGHPLIATCLFDSAFAYTETGDLDGALELLEEALAIRRRSLGDEHVAVADALNNIGHIHWRRGDLEESYASIEEAVATYRRSAGEGDPRVLRGLDALAGLAERMDRLERADALHAERVELAVRYRDPDSDEVREAREALAAFRERRRTSPR